MNALVMGVPKPDPSSAHSIAGEPQYKIGLSRQLRVPLEQGQPVRIPVPADSDAVGQVCWSPEEETADWVPVTALADQTLWRDAALLRHRRTHRFHPADGTPLHHSADGMQATSTSGKLLFPRIDPCVIGIVEHAHTHKILLGRNRLRPGYFSLIAGYISPGESIEQAFAREVLEETGRRVHDVRYLRSQPWPASGSLMLGMHGVTEDDEPVCETDDELEELRWFSREELREGNIALTRPGSIAHTLIKEWIAQG